MKMMRNITLFIIAIALTVSAQAQSLDGKKMSEKMPFYSNVLTGTLDNGMKYYIMENNMPENRAELQIVVKAGAVQEEDDQKGLAHFIEHMCFNGTKHFPKNELISFLESTGMRFGGDVNANTGFDRTYYLLTIPTDKDGMIDDGLQVLQDWMAYVDFDQDELDKERQVILEEWRVYRGANDRVQKKHLPVLLWGSKFADRLPIGDTAVILNAPREAFLRYYKDWYRPNISAVIAVGNFDKDEMLTKIKDLFGDLENPKNPRELEEYEIPLHNDIKVSIAKDPELPTPVISIYFKHKGMEKGTYASYVESLKERLVSTMFTERFQEFIQDPESPFSFYAGGGIGDFIGDLKAGTLIAIPKTERFEDALETLLIEGFRAKKHGFTEGELERAKKQIMTFYESAYKDRENVKSADYAREFYQYFYDGTAAPGIEIELDVVKEVFPKITTEHVNQMVDKYIRDEAVVVAISAPEKDDVIVPSEKEVLAIFNKVKNMEIAAFEDVAADQPLMTSLPKPGKVVSEDVIDDVNVEEWILSNGARVLLKKTDFKEDEILFRAYSPGGYSLAPKDMYLSASNASSIVDAAGISEFDTPTLQKMLSGQDLSISPYIDELVEGFQGSSSPDDLETFMQLLYLYFTNPRKDVKSFEAFKQRMQQSIVNMKKNPGSALSDTINTVLNQYHYTSKPLEVEDLSKIDLEKAYKFYTDRFADAGDFTFVFVGNIDKDNMKKMVEQYIASLPTKERKESWKDLGIRTPKGKINKEVKKGIEPKSTVRLVITGTAPYSQDEDFAIRSMVEVLRIRLREVIREDKGGVYGIGAFGRLEKYPYDNYSLWVYFGTAPDKVDDLVQTTKDILNEVKKGNFDETYVEKVKQIMKSERETNLKENRYWLENIYQYSWNGLNLEDINDYDAKIESIDKAMIVDAAKKYIDMNNFKEFILNPEG